MVRERKVERRVCSSACPALGFLPARDFYNATLIEGANIESSACNSTPLPLSLSLSYSLLLLSLSAVVFPIVVVVKYVQPALFVVCPSEFNWFA